MINSFSHDVVSDDVMLIIALKDKERHNINNTVARFTVHDIEFNLTAMSNNSRKYDIERWSDYILNKYSRITDEGSIYYWIKPGSIKIYKNDSLEFFSYRRIYLDKCSNSILWRDDAVINNTVHEGQIETIIIDESFDYRDISNPIRKKVNYFYPDIDLSKNPSWTVDLITNTYKLNDHIFDLRSENGIFSEIGDDTLLENDFDVMEVENRLFLIKFGIK